MSLQRGEENIDGLTDPATVSTPVLAVDEGVLLGNIAAVHDRLRAAGVAIRPHVKTHKSIEIARRQRDHGASGITVATVGEAEVFAEAGFDDIMIAYPVWLDPAKAERLSRLADLCQLVVGVDSLEGADHLGQRLDPRIGVVIEVDSGHHRTGCAPGEAGQIALALARQTLNFRGVFTFPGHSYAPGAAADVAVQESNALARAARATRKVGLAPQVISGGSTPSIEAADADVLTEARPGVYVFNDAQQWELGRCSTEQIALWAFARVVSVRGARVVLDAGSKILSADRAPYATGHGRLLDHEGARIVQLSEHHAVVELDRPGDLALGDVVRVVPNHVCTAINLVDSLLVIGADGLAGTWKVAARGANT